MRTAFLSVLLFFVYLTATAIATPQKPDRIEYMNEAFEFGGDFVSPLYSLLQADPTKWPKEFPRGGSGLWNSGLQRGHLALYRVSQGKLWLASVDVPIADDESLSRLGRFIDDRPFVTFPLSRMFPDCQGAVHVAWFSGDIKISRPTTPEELSKEPSVAIKQLTLTFKDGRLVSPQVHGAR